MRTIRIFLLITFFGFLCQAASAQRYKDRGTDNEVQESQQETQDPATMSQWDKIRKRLLFGGYVNGGLSNVGMFLDISPQVGYKVTEKLLTGVGGTYIYSSSKYPLPNGQTYKSSFNIYGGRTFAQQLIFSGVFAHAEYEALNVPYLNSFYEVDRRWIGNPLIGAGYRSSIGARSFFSFAVLYNLNYKNNQAYSPYSSPIVMRFGIML